MTPQSIRLRKRTLAEARSRARARQGLRAGARGGTGHELARNPRGVQHLARRQRAPPASASRISPRSSSRSARRPGGGRSGHRSAISPASASSGCATLPASPGPPSRRSRTPASTVPATTTSNTSGRRRSWSTRWSGPSRSSIVRSTPGRSNRSTRSSAHPESGGDRRTTRGAPRCRGRFAHDIWHIAELNEALTAGRASSRSISGSDRSA